MKKFTTIILFCCCISMAFTTGECAFFFADNTEKEINTVDFIKLLLGDGNSEGTIGIAVGNNGTIYRSLGADTINFTPLPSGTTQNLNGLRVEPTNYEPKMLAVGNNGTIVYSINEGESWNVAPQITSSNLYDADNSSVYDYAAGDNGTIVYSYDNGATWFPLSSGTTRNLKAIGINPVFGGTVIAVGEKGSIIRSTNSGQNWTNISLADTSITFYAISKERPDFEENIMLIVGSGGKIYKSTNQGLMWVLKNSGTTNTLRSVYFVSADSGAVTGDNGTVRMTTNGGETWFTDNAFSSLAGSITSISEMPRSSRTFTAVVNNRFMGISEDPPFVGINIINTEIPKAFSLSQNYPNPFNPTTNIKFAIPKAGSVKLTIFDMLGKEIETLVNEELHAGTYEYEWNGINLSSGVYFYKLTAGNSTETKKMLMVK